MAVWAILGFVSGTVGRAFVTDEGIGVNNFLILSAGSNTGKTQHWSALSAMVRVSAPNLMDHVLGGDTSSARIIAKEGQAMGSMALRVPDGGMWLASIMEGRTQLNQQLRSALLNIYEAAGEGDEWHIPKSLRAKGDGNHSISEFNMSIVLDTTPQYVTSFDLSDFTDGLMSRFIMIYGPEVISELQEPKRGNDVPSTIKNTFDSLAKVYVSCSRPTDPTVGNVPPRMVVAHEQGLTGRDGYMWALEKVRCPSFLDTCLVQFMLSCFIVNWRQHAVVRVFAVRVVEHLNVIKHVLPCRVACDVGPSPDPLAFQELEEALCDSIIMAVSTSTHACIQIVFAEKRLPLLAGVLRALI